MSLTYFRADERPAWQATVTVNGVADDLSTGHTFQVKAATAADPDTAVLTKSTGIAGAAGGVVTVSWAPNELDLEPGRYVVQLKVSRTSDAHEWTVRESMLIRPRL
jgi:hypothetical protein